MLFPKFLTVLGAELIRTFRAFQGGVGFVPEALRVNQYEQLPDEPGNNRHDKQRYGVKTAHENNGREHHQMVPVEDPAGGAAAVAHDQTEGAPDQHSDQIADIKAYADEEKSGFVDDSVEIENSDYSNQGAPEDKYLVCSLGGGLDIAAQGIPVDFLPNGPEAVGKDLLGA